MSRKTSCGIAELFPLQFEYVLGIFVALRKQLEDEEKERKRQEKSADGQTEVNMSNYTSQASSMMNKAMSSAKLPNAPSLPNVSLPKV